METLGLVACFQRNPEKTQFSNWDVVLYVWNRPPPNCKARLGNGGKSPSSSDREKIKPMVLWYEEKMLGVVCY